MLSVLIQSLVSVQVGCCQVTKLEMKWKLSIVIKLVSPYSSGQSKTCP